MILLTVVLVYLLLWAIAGVRLGVGPVQGVWEGVKPFVGLAAIVVAAVVIVVLGALVLIGGAVVTTIIAIWAPFALILSKKHRRYFRELSKHF